jgi:hypothetical protein
VKLFKVFPPESSANFRLDPCSLAKQAILSLFAAALVLLLIASPAHSESIILSWTPPVNRVDSTPLTNLSGIKIYWGSSTGNYDHTLDVGNRTNATVSGFTAGSTYYFAVKAYDSNGLHSAYSSEVSYTVSSDTDHDGLSNNYENSHGLNPNVADSDGDGVNDGQEVADGTNPRDGGSVAPVLGTTICSEWNGFLGGMWNVFEHTNMSSHSLAVTSTIYNIEGAAQSSFGFNIAAGAQFDSLIHDSPSRAANSYGLVCSAHNGATGELDGRMVYYKPNAVGARKKGDFQFAFAMALTAGKHGSQFVPFNTFQPSLAAVDASHPIANWIQLTNLGGTAGAGQLIYYDQSGNQLGLDLITLQPGARSDFAAHRFGGSVVGTVEWRPNTNDNLYLMRNVRYLYDNATGVNSFDSAFQLEAMQGSGGEQIVPIDTISRTAVVEIFNTLNQAVTVDVTVAGGAGASFSLDLPAHGSYHYIADPVLGTNGLGYAIIKGRTLGSIGAVAMEYGRRSDLGIAYLFGVPAKEAVGTTLRGSYNTYLGQTSWLVLVSPVAQNVNIVAVKNNGQVAGQRSVNVNGIGAVNLNELDGVDSYGVVTVQPENPNSMIGWVLRVKDGEYVIPTPLR